VRILHVIQEMRTGGAERVVVSLTRGATDAGHDVAVASAGGELLAELEGVQHFTMPLLQRRAAVVPGAALALARALRRWRPQIVHCHNPAMGVVTSLATLRGRGCPGLVSVHGVPEEDWPATARVLRLSRLPVVACGPGVATALAEHGLQVAATIWNGVSPPPPPADRVRLEREWDVEPGRPLLLAVGRLVPAKNFALAIDAVAQLDDATLVLAGEGPLREELMAHARAAGVDHRVVFAGLRRDARSVMAAADAVLVSSRSEGLPMVLLEALAAGTPVVATAVRGIREVLTDEENALLVEPEDARALAGAASRVLSDETLATRLADAGRRLAAEHSDAAMLASFLELYERQAA
jgi:glycosyltransferase involved in cell wall biosynthesis